MAIKIPGYDYDGVAEANSLYFGPAEGDGVPVGPANPLPVIGLGYGYETVAAGASTTPLGATGAAGDYLMGLLVIPASTSPGAVTLTDNATFTVFTGGANSVGSLVPFFVPLGAAALNAAGWRVTTGANVSVVAVGRFT